MTASAEFPQQHVPRSFFRGRIFGALGIFFGLEFLLLCVLFGFPIDAVPVIGAYSFWTNIFFGLAATAAAFSQYRRLGWKLHRISGTILTAHLVFTAYLLVNLIQTDDIYHFGVRKSVLVLIGGCWTIFAASAVAANPDGPKRFVQAMLVYGLLFTMLNHALPTMTGGFLRATLTENYQHASRAAGLGVIACLALLTHKYLSFRIKSVLVLLLMMGLAAQLGSGGRTGLGASFICIFVFLLLNIRIGRGSLRVKKRFFLFAILAIFGIAALTYAIMNGWRPATVNRFLIILEGATELNVSFSNRVGRYQKFDELFSQAPIFGHGTGSWDEVSGEVESYYPHNLIMELLVEQGIVGAMLLLGPLLVFFARFTRIADIRNDYRMQSIVLYMVYVITTTMFTGDLGLNMYLYSVLALLACAQPNEDNTGRLQDTGRKMPGSQ